MDHFETIYKDNLLYVFEKHLLKKAVYDYLVVIKDDCEAVEIPGCLTLHYSDDFESLLVFPLPTKMRKANQLISLRECRAVMDRIIHGVLAISNDQFPYCVSMIHILMGNRIYFHGAKSGYKLTGINRRATYLIVEDLGLRYKIGSHSNRSVAVFGTLREVTDYTTKKIVLEKLKSDYGPSHPLDDALIDHTNVLELEVDYIIGKEHIR